MKRVLYLSVILYILLFIFSVPVNATPSVILDGNNLTFEVAPIIEDGRTLVPLRAIFEAMGATVAWDSNTQTITATKGNTTVVLKIGSLYPTINGRVNKLDVPAKIINGRTLVPLRFVGEAFGGNVLWNDVAQTININSSTGQNVTAYKITLDFSSGTREGEYTGTLVNGVPHGKGEFKSKNSSGTGWIYTGEFVKGQFKGSGYTIWENGYKEEGIYENNQLIKGTSYINGVIHYTGEWKNGNASGQGKLYTNGKLIYEGTFVNGLPEESSFKSKCINIEYNSIARNPDNYIGNPIKFTGKVFQAIEGKDKAVTYLISVNNDYDTVFYASYVYKSGEPRVLKDDKVDVWGYFQGLFTYKSILGADITKPNINIQYLKIQGTYSSSSTTTQTTITPATPPTTSNNNLEQRKAQCLSELNELATKLENVKNERNTKIWQNGRWEYVADPQAVAAAQKAYDQKYAEYQRLLNQ